MIGIFLFAMMIYLAAWMAIPHTLDEKLAGSRRLSQNATRCNTETIQGINYLKKGKIQSEDETSFLEDWQKSFQPPVNPWAMNS